jgi:hypothetical protein
MAYRAQSVQYSEIQCIEDPPWEETIRLGSWVAFVRRRTTKAALLSTVRRVLALESPVDNDGPSASRQSGGTTRLGSTTSGVSLRTPDRAIAREGRGSAYAPRSRLSASDQRVGQSVDGVPTQTLQPYILFCVPAPAVSPHGAYLSHICRKQFTGHEFCTRLNAEFDRLRGSTTWSKFWARVRVIGCQEIKLVRVSVPDHLSTMRQAEYRGSLYVPVIRHCRMAIV